MSGEKRRPREGVVSKPCWGRAVLVAALAAVSPGVAAAEPAVGSYTIQVGSELPIWPDAIGQIDECEDFDDGSVCIQLLGTTDARGRILGSGNITIDTSAASADLDLALRGRIRGSNGSARIDVSMSIAGEAESSGLVVPVTGNGKLSGVIDPILETLVGELRVKICAKGVGCEGGVFPIEAPLEGDGAWTLDLDLHSSDGRTIGGSAVATLEDGSSFDYVVRGRHDVRRDESSLQLKGVGSALGSSMQLRHVVVESGTLRSAELCFKLLGQQGSGVITP